MVKEAGVYFCSWQELQAEVKNPDLHVGLEQVKNDQNHFGGEGSWCFSKRIQGKEFPDNTEFKYFLHFW